MSHLTSFRVPLQKNITRGPGYAVGTIRFLRMNYKLPSMGYRPLPVVKMLFLLATQIIFSVFSLALPKNSENLKLIGPTLSTILLANIWTGSDLQQKLAHCTLKLVGGSNYVMPAELFETENPKIIISNLSIVPQKVANVNTRDEFGAVEVALFNAFRHTSNCEKDVIFLGQVTSKLNLYPAFEIYQLRSLLQFPFNTHPQRIYHIFVGREEQIRKILEEKSIKTLRYKTGIAVSHDSSIPTLITEDGHFPSKIVNLTVSSYAEEGAPKYDVLQNHHITVHSYPYKTHVLEDAFGTKIGGPGYNFMKILADRFNLTFDYNYEGYRNRAQMPNGSWNGFIDDLVHCRADLVLFLSSSVFRSPYADLTPAVLNFKLMFFTALPQSQLNRSSFLSVFDSTVWVSIVSVLLLTNSLLYFRFKFINIKFPQTFESPFYLSILLSYSSAVGQYLEAPKGARILITTFAFYYIIVCALFSSSLSAFLAKPVQQRVPETPEELARMTDYRVKYIQYPGAAGDEFFAHTTNPMYLNLKKRFEYVNQSFMDTAMMETAVEKKIATINFYNLGLSSVAQNLTISPNYVPLQMSKTPIFDMPTSIGLRKYSKFTEPISLQVGRLQNTGHFDKWFDQALDVSRKDGVAWLKKVKKRGPKESLGYKIVRLAEEAIGPKSRAFSLYHVVVRLFGVTACLAVATVAFCSEILVFTRKIEKQVKVEYALTKSDKDEPGEAAALEV